MRDSDDPESGAGFVSRRIRASALLIDESGDALGDDLAIGVAVCQRGLRLARASRPPDRSRLAPFAFVALHELMICPRKREPTEPRHAKRI